MPELRAGRHASVGPFLPWPLKCMGLPKGLPMEFVCSMCGVPTILSYRDVPICVACDQKRQEELPNRSVKSPKLIVPDPPKP
jgi:hypothetical protein